MSGADQDRRAYVGNAVQLFRERAWKPDATMAGRITGVEACVQGDSIAVDELRERHRCVVELLRVMHRFLAEHGEDTGGRVASLDTAGNRGDRHQRVAA